MTKKIGIMIITGFLGSGKTTLLRHLLHDHDLASRIAILINEFGEIGLDQELVRHEHRTAHLHIKQLSSGCICCTVRGNLPQALKELCDLSSSLPERILIETSGISKASELSYAINVLSQESPFYTDSIVTVVDAKHARRAYEESPSLFLDQLSYADIVLLNKYDLLSSTEEEHQLLAWLKPLAPRATWLPTKQARVSLPLLLGLPRKTTPSGLMDAPIGSNPQHDFTQVTIPMPAPVLYEDLERWLYACSDKIFRIKGIVDIRNEHGHIQPILVQAVGDRVDTEELDTMSPLRQSDRYLVFIRIGFDQEALQADLAKLIRTAPRTP